MEIELREAKVEIVKVPNKNGPDYNIPWFPDPIFNREKFEISPIVEPKTKKTNKPRRSKDEIIQEKKDKKERKEIKKMMQLTKIEYVSAPTGSGKTKALEKLALNLAFHFNKKVVIAQGEKDLIEQTIKHLNEKNVYNVPITVIYSDNTSKDTVAQRIEDHVRTAKTNIGEILLVTHAGLLNTVNVFRDKKWTLLCDELIKWDHFHNFSLKNNRHILLDFISTKCDADIPGLANVYAKDIDKAELILKTRDDVVDSIFRSLSNHLLHPHFENWSLQSDLTNFQNGYTSTGKDYHIFNMVSILQPTFFNGFEKTIFFAANFMQSPLVYDFYKKGITFKENKDVELDYTSHTNGDRINCYKMADKWSRKQADLVDEDGISNRVILIDFIFK